MTPAKIDLKDIPANVRKGLKIPRQQTYTKEMVRQDAIHVLHAVAHLDQAERARVLKHAMHMNGV